VAVFPACAVQAPEVEAAEAAEAQILFVCLHGNVKSLMASSYFNEQAEQRTLPFRAESRGVDPDSTTVPPPIAERLNRDGFDVSAFRPRKVGVTDVSGSGRVVLIGTELPADLQLPGVPSEQWNDVPPASVNYDDAWLSLKSHVDRLIGQLVDES
jgi:hypothetical protein